MADFFGNLIKIWGGVTEDSASIAADLQDGMLAYCPFEKVAVWRRDETHYETIASTERVLRLVVNMLRGHCLLLMVMLQGSTAQLANQ